jgi:mannose-6-phosphate isomerase-like protein (cupin superfamily)
MKHSNINQEKVFSSEKFTKKTLFDSAKLVVDIYCFEPGQELALHQHANSDQVFFFVEGEGIYAVGGETKSVGPADCTLAPAGVDHGIKNTGSKRMVAFQVTAPRP